jgi:hypothetical protein
MANLNPLKYCFRCKCSKPRATFRSVPGDASKGRLCADCYGKITQAEQATRDSTSKSPQSNK